MKKAALLFLILFHSCTYHRISTDTFADSSAIPFGFSRESSFEILPMPHENPLFSKEVAQKVARILERRGYRIAKPGEADYVLRFSFGMNRRVVTEQVAKSIPGKVESKKKFVKDDDGSVNFVEKFEASEKTIYVPEERTYYEKELIVNVSNQSGQVWNGSSRNNNMDDDLRETIDYLLASVFGHFGSNTRRTVITNMNEDDLKKFY